MSIAADIQTAGRVTTSNSKMPGSSYPTDPFACKRGSKLAQVAGSVCSVCYARRLATYREVVGKGWAKNQHKLDHADANDWVEAMVRQITRAAEKTGQPFHRWFDAGDLASTANLDRIAGVCRRTPTIRHWLPTREIGIVRAWIAAGNIVPRNLVIRLSSPMIGQEPLLSTARVLGKGIACSTVHAHSQKPKGHICPASTQGNSCGSCRACWDRRVRTVSYPKH